MAGMPNGWGPMGMTDSQLDMTLAKIKAKAAEIGADANVLRRTMVPFSQPGQPDSGRCQAVLCCTRGRQASCALHYWLLAAVVLLKTYPNDCLQTRADRSPICHSGHQHPRRAN